MQQVYYFDDAVLCMSKAPATMICLTGFVAQCVTILDVSNDLQQKSSLVRKG